MGAKVVNASLGGPGLLPQAQLDAVNASPNTLFVVAAGNDGNNNDVSPRYPCNLPAANVVCVAATDRNDALAELLELRRDELSTSPLRARTS